MLQQKVINIIKKYNLIESGDNIVLGVSGGPDSICMLECLKNIKNELKFSIYVAHINHMMRKEADMEEKYVYDYCKKNNIQCFIKKENVIKKSKIDKICTEEAGRNLRYSFFEECAQIVGAQKIATAHTANDNAETVLMNIIRGSGTTGLRGIEPIRDNKFIRPLIKITRKEIEEYCEQNNLQPCIDKTNEQNIYTRNKIRNLLIPYIKQEFNPNIIETINRLSNVVQEEDRFIENITKNAYKDIKIEETQKQIELDLKKFNNLEKVIKNRIVLYTINMLFGTSKGIEKIHIEDIIKLCENNIGNKFLIPNKKMKILVKNKKIFFISNIEHP